MSVNQSQEYHSEQNISSPLQPKQSNSSKWTKEEMEKSEPFPILEIPDDEKKSE